MAKGIDCSAPDDDSGLDFLIVITSKHREESSFGISIHSIVSLASSDDFSIVKFNRCIGVDGIIGAENINSSAIENNTFLTFDTFSPRS